MAVKARLPAMNEWLHASDLPYSAHAVELRQIGKWLRRQSRSFGNGNEADVHADRLLVGAQGGWQSPCSEANPSPTAVPVVVVQAKTTAAIVEDVDPQARHVLLRLPDDTLVTLKVGPEAKNLAQIKPGDDIIARYVEAMLLNVNETADASRPIQKMSAASIWRYCAGADHDCRRRSVEATVSFVGPNNVVETIDVAGDGMIKAVTKLKPGNKADVAYTPAVALNPEGA